MEDRNSTGLGTGLWLSIHNHFTTFSGVHLDDIDNELRLCNLVQKDVQIQAHYVVLNSIFECNSKGTSIMITIPCSSKRNTDHRL